MEIKIIGKPKTGKTIVATRIKEMLESLGAMVILEDTDRPKHVPPNSKPLSRQKVIVSVECKYKEALNEGSKNSNPTT